METAATAVAEPTGNRGSFLGAAFQEMKDAERQASKELDQGLEVQPTESQSSNPPEEVDTTVEETQSTTKYKPKEKAKKKVEISSDPLADLMKEDKPEEAQVEEFDSSDIDNKYPDKPENVDAKGLAKWGEIKGELKATKLSAHQLNRSLAQKTQELEQLKSELESVKSSGTDGNEWKQKYESILKKNAIFELEEDPDYQSKVIAPLQQATDNLNGLIKHLEIPASEINKVLHAENRFERNKILSEIINSHEIDPVNKDDLVIAIRDYESLKVKEAEARERAEELYEAGREKRQQAEQQQRESLINQRLESEDKVFSAVSKHPVFSEVFEGKTGELRDMVKKSLREESRPEIAVFEKMASFAHRPLVEAIAERNARIAELEATIKNHVNGGAAIGAKSTASAEPDVLPEKGQSIREFFESQKRGSQY